MSPVRQKIKFDKKLIDKDAIDVIKVLNKARFEAYLVGGCIRDLLVNITPKDFDIVTNATPNQAKKLFKRSRVIGKRFRLLHVVCSARKFIEVATFRASNEADKNAKNLYGTIEQDAFRRDFTINALYYDFSNLEIIDYVGGLEDIKSLEIKMIGDPDKRFVEDPVRMIRAIRFANKLSTKLSQEIVISIKNNAKLLKNISPDRLFGECVKLFHSENSFDAFQKIEELGLLKQLFWQTKADYFIEKALINTSFRIKQNKSVTPAFLFAVFLWDAQKNNFARLKKNKNKKPIFVLMKEAAETVIKKQNQQVMLPRWVSNKIYDTWFMQYKLENFDIKNNKQEIISLPAFRMAYDFLVLRSESINPELKEKSEFWTVMQNN